MFFRVLVSFYTNANGNGYCEDIINIGMGFGMLYFGL